MAANTKQYSDFDLDFTPHPVSGDITILTGVDSVKRAVRNLILSAPYERIFRPNLGSGVRQLLFEPINPLTQKTLEQTIKDVLNTFEKRVTVLGVDAKVNTDENGYNVTVTFAVDSESTLATVDIFLERIR